MAQRIIYKCADGRDFPVEWEDPADAELTWRYDPSHAPLPCPDIEAELRTTARIEELQRVFAGLGFQSPNNDDRTLVINGFAYTHRPHAAGPQILPDVDRFNEQNGGVRAVWESLCLPRIREVCPRPSIRSSSEA